MACIYRVWSNDEDVFFSKDNWTGELEATCEAGTLEIFSSIHGLWNDPVDSHQPMKRFGSLIHQTHFELRMNDFFGHLVLTVCQTHCHVPTPYLSWTAWFRLLMIQWLMKLGGLAMKMKSSKVFFWHQPLCVPITWKHSPETNLSFKGFGKNEDSVG